MTSCEKYILEYSAGRATFRSCGLLSATEESGFSKTAVNWFLHKLTSERKLCRVGRGVYSVVFRQEFRNEPDEPLINLARQILDQYPGVRACFYQGAILSPLLHHLSYNALTYIEVQRELTEILFHRLQEAGEKVYLKPSREMMQNYIDISKSGIIIKPLISGSPVTIESGIPMPALEKIIVDTLCDEDFSYLQGCEWEYIVENAFSLFSINSSRLFRYAGRRGKLQEIKEAIKPYYYDTYNYTGH